jgi:hypothetical protein
MVKKAERLRVNTAACFLWVALVASLLVSVDHTPGPICLATGLLVLAYLCQEVRAVVLYVGTFKEYQGGGETLLERSTQISTAAFAAGTILLSAKKDMTAKVAPFVFLALLLCVVSAVPSGASQKNGLGEHATWESAQKVGMSTAAGLLALAIAMCADTQLSLGS